jgi:hypothetical protein
MTEQFAHLSDLVEDIKATGDSTIAAIACRALNDVLQLSAEWQEVEV